MLWRAVCHTFRMTLHTHSKEHPAERIIPVQKSTDHFLFASDGILLHIPFIVFARPVCMALPLGATKSVSTALLATHAPPATQTQRTTSNQFKPEKNLR
jgi:hypothetical protein